MPACRSYPFVFAGTTQRLWWISAWVLRKAATLHSISESTRTAWWWWTVSRKGDGRRKRECFLTLSCQASHLSFDSWCWRMNTRCVGPPGCGAPWPCWGCCGETHGESNSDVITTDQFFVCFVFLTHGLSCSTACEIFLDQGLNACPLHWQADSQPLNHQGGPLCPFLNWGVCCRCGTPLCALCLVRLDKPKSQSSEQRKVYWRVKQGAWEVFAQNTQLPDGFLERVFLFGLVWFWFWGFFGHTVWLVGILLP